MTGHEMATCGIDRNILTIALEFVKRETCIFSNFGRLDPGQQGKKGRT